MLSWYNGKIGLIGRTRCYLLEYYLRDVGEDPEKGTGRAGLGKKSEGGETGRVGLGKIRKVVEGIFAESGETWLVLKLLCVFTRQDCENQGGTLWAGKGKQRLLFTKHSVFSNKEIFT